MSNLTAFLILVSKIILSSYPMPSTGCVHADQGQIHNHIEQVKMKLGLSPLGGNQHDDEVMLNVLKCPLTY